MSMNNIFEDDLFSSTTLTDAVRDVEARPSSIGNLDIFEETSVSTTTIAIERIGDLLKLVGPTPRGGPGETRDAPKRTLRAFVIPHFEINWSVYADEVQNVREFGSDSAMKSIMNTVADRIKLAIDDLDLTDEYSRLGAVQGEISYADGTSLDLFSEFGVVPPTEVDFDLDNASPVDGILRQRCTEMIRATRTALGGVQFRELRAVVGNDFFDDLLRHREVRETYKGWSENKILRESYVGANMATNPTFEFGGIVWENYGAVASTGDGALVGVDKDKARFFPIGVPGLFKSYLAPADYIETVNTPGLKTYVRSKPMGNDKGMHGDVQRNVLHLCTRPAALMRAKRT